MARECFDEDLPFRAPLEAWNRLAAEEEEAMFRSERLDGDAPRTGGDDVSSRKNRSQSASRRAIADRITEKMPTIDGEKRKPPPPQISQTPVTVDDAARKDGGKTTEDQKVPAPELEKICDNAVEHGRDEPGS